MAENDSGNVNKGAWLHSIRAEIKWGNAEVCAGAKTNSVRQRFGFPYPNLSRPLLSIAHRHWYMMQSGCRSPICLQHATSTDKAAVTMHMWDDTSDSEGKSMSAQKLTYTSLGVAVRFVCNAMLDPWHYVWGKRTPAQTVTIIPQKHRLQWGALNRCTQYIEPSGDRFIRDKASVRECVCVVTHVHQHSRGETARRL